MTHKSLNDATKRLAREAVRQLVEFVGPGFHPDTKIADYTDHQGRLVFPSDDEQWGAQRLLDFAWESLGEDIYEVGLECQRIAIENFRR